MQDKLYQDVKNYLETGEMPQEVPLTKSNFIATAGKYSINERGFLTRKNKLTVRISEQAGIYEAFHNHSGRAACWERINAR